jgi:nickel transport protein
MALKLYTGCFIFLFCFFCTVFLVWAPSGVLAHQLSVFAWVEGDNVKVEGKLPKGKHPKQGMVFVYDGNDRLLLQKQIQPDGTATFPLKNWETGLKILLDIGDGHQSYWILTPFDIKQQRGEKMNKKGR